MQREFPVFDILKFKQDLINKQFNLNQELIVMPTTTPSIKGGDPPDKVALYNKIYQKIRHQEEDIDDTPKPWVAPVYSSVRTFEGAIPDIIESLKSDDDKIEYESEEARQNFRALIKNIGDLYINNLEIKKK